MTQVVVIIGLLIMVLAALFLLLAIKYSSNLRKKQAELFKAVIQAQTDEQHRIGRDLHDQASPLLATIGLHVDTLRKKYPQEPILTEIVAIATETQQNIREASHNLMPDVLIRYGLIKAIEGLINKINNHSSTLHVTLTYTNEARINSIDTLNSVHLYRIISEAINNALKHAAASSLVIDIDASSPNVMLIRIKDNGKGFDITINSHGIGLKSMVSRVKLLGGSIDIQSTIGKGTMLVILLDGTQLN